MVAIALEALVFLLGVGIGILTNLLSNQFSVYLLALVVAFVCLSLILLIFMGGTKHNQKNDREAFRPVLDRLVTAQSSFKSISNRSEKLMLAARNVQLSDDHKV